MTYYFRNSRPKKKKKIIKFLQNKRKINTTKTSLWMTVRIQITRDILERKDID